MKLYVLGIVRSEPRGDFVEFGFNPMGLSFEYGHSGKNENRWLGSVILPDSSAYRRCTTPPAKKNGVAVEQPRMGQPRGI
jgi:hypothetical protein